MNETLAIAVAAALALTIVLAAAVLWRITSLARSREEETRNAVREAADLKARLDALIAQIAHVEGDIRQDLANHRTEQNQTAATLRGEVGGAIGKFRDATQQQLTDMAGLQQRQLAGFGE